MLGSFISSDTQIHGWMVEFANLNVPARLSLGGWQVRIPLHNQIRWAYVAIVHTGYFEHL